MYIHICETKRVTAWSARVNTKERRVRREKKNKKRIEAQRGKTPTPTRANGSLIGDEEQSENHKKEQKERNRERALNPGILDNSVASYDPQGS